MSKNVFASIERTTQRGRRLTSCLMLAVCTALCAVFVSGCAHLAAGDSGLAAPDDTKTESGPVPDTPDIEYPRNLSAYLIPDVKMEIGSRVMPADLFDAERLLSETACTQEMLDQLCFEEPPADEVLAAPGTIAVVICAGQKKLPATFTLQDTTPPTLAVPEELEVMRGDPILYREGLSVSDNAPGEPEIRIDSSGVNANVAGTYTVNYEAVDASGNRTCASAVVIVRDDHVVTREEVDALAKEVLSELQIDTLAEEEKARAVYEWCFRNISSTANAEKKSILDGAYDGLYHREGDCYTVYATASCLLDHCGIENTGVSKKEKNAVHYWSLVKIGDGWYHFDADRMPGGYHCFLQTDAQVRAYADEYRKDPAYYEFEETGKPKRSETEIYDGFQDCYLH